MLGGPEKIPRKLGMTGWGWRLVSACDGFGRLECPLAVMLVGVVRNLCSGKGFAVILA